MKTSQIYWVNSKNLYIQRNERFFEEQGQITEIVLSLSGEHQISINNNDFYILKNYLNLRSSESLVAWALREIS